MGVDAVEAALRVGKPKIADQVLLDTVVLQPENGRVFGMEFHAFEKFKAPDADILVGAGVVAHESLLEEGCGRFGVVGARCVVSTAEAELALRSDRGNCVVRHVAYPRLRELSLPVPVVQSLGE